MKAVQFPSQLTKLETRVDGSIKVILETQELNGQDMADLFAYRGQLGYTTFTPNPETAIVVPDIRVEDNSKSPAQRLRNVLYILWEQQGKTKFDTFEMWYNVNMERIISQIKDRLDNER
jgi:hypothetical protein